MQSRRNSQSPRTNNRNSPFQGVGGGASAGAGGGTKRKAESSLSKQQPNNKQQRRKSFDETTTKRKDNTTTAVVGLHKAKSQKFEKENNESEQSGGDNFQQLKNLNPEERRKAKKEQKIDKREKKLSKVNGQLAYDSKIIWEEVRQKKINPEKRSKQIDELLILLEGKIQEIAMKRDTSRVIQSILKYGDEKQKTHVFDALKANILHLTKHGYAHNLVIKMLKYGTKEQRAFIVSQFYGKVRFLVKHKEASTVVEAAYIEYCNSEQRKSLLEEFYGPEFSLFKSGEKKTLKEILENNPQKKVHILKFLREYLFSLTNKPDILKNSIVHKPLLQYLEYASYSDKLEMVQFMQDHVLRFLHSRDGSKAAILCFGYGTPKERKIIVKTFKGYVPKICKEEFGHLGILATFSYVDDTVLLKSAILKEMAKDVKSLALDKHGHLPILAIIKGITKTYFSPSTLSLLQPKTMPDPQNPDQQIPTSKKTVEKRREELLEAILGDVVETLSADPLNSYSFVTNTYAANILTETIELVIDVSKKEKLVDNLLCWINFEEKEVDRKYHPMEKQPELHEDLLYHPIAYTTLKRLVKTDEMVARKVLDKISPKIITYAQHKNGSWVVLALFANSATRDQVLELLRPHVESLKQIDEKETKAPKRIAQQIEEPEKHNHENENENDNDNNNTITNKNTKI